SRRSPSCARPPSTGPTGRRARAVEEPDVRRRTRGTRRAFLAKGLSGFCAFCVDRRFAPEWRASMTNALGRTVLVAAAACLCCVSSNRVAAQTVGASLQGIVTDSTGGAIPNADVVVINTATGGVRELKTDPAGRYRIPV